MDDLQLLRRQQIAFAHNAIVIVVAIIVAITVIVVVVVIMTVGVVVVVVHDAVGVDCTHVMRRIRAI